MTLTGRVRRHLLTAAAILAVGCGGGVTRYEVYGTVTYDGKPVPSGFITFSPDTEKGNDGPGGGAPIENGEYRTTWDKGVVGGPHLVRIIGQDGVPSQIDGEEVAAGRSLFRPYQTTIDLPKQSSRQNFEVPKSTK